MDIRAIPVRTEPSSMSYQGSMIGRPLFGERRAPLRRIARRHWAPVVAISLALHLTSGIFLRGAPGWLSGRRPADPPVFAQIEMVDLPLRAVGDGAHHKGAAQDASPQDAAPPPALQAPTSANPRPAEPTPAVPTGAAEIPPPAPPVEPAPAAPDRPVSKASEPPQTRLDESDDLGRGLVRNVIPAGPDSNVHNDPPSYPRLAAQYGEAGTVRLLVLVAPDGSARDVQVTESSGYERLDRAAREAVAKWHFRAAQRDGIPVESYFPVNVQFDLGNK